MSTCKASNYKCGVGSLKRIVKAVYVVFKDRKAYTIWISADTQQKGEKIIRYYQLRFQIEFLIGDAKQYSGLEECQARTETKLYNHFNMSLMIVPLMKLTLLGNLNKQRANTFLNAPYQNLFL